LFSQCKAPKTSDTTESTEVNIQSTGISTAAIDEIVGVKWIHSREDDQNGHNYYLDGDKKSFPPSRFRNSLLFNDDGTCAYMQLSSTDRHHMVDGTYIYEDGKITINKVTGDKYNSYQVIEIVKDTLILKQIPQSTDY
jgi:hypothetical protein